MRERPSRRLSLLTNETLPDAVDFAVIVMQGRPGKRHLNVSLSSERLNRLGQTGYATPAHIRKLKKLLPGQ